MCKAIAVDVYAMAEDVMQDMARREYGDPYAGHRAILAPALRVKGERQRRRIVARVLGDLMQCCYYPHREEWSTRQQFRDVLVERMAALCDEIEEADAAMQAIAGQQRKRAARGMHAVGV